MLNKEILSKIDSIVSYIKDTDDYKRFIYIQEKMSKNEKLMSLIESIKIKQKELVKDNSSENNESYSKLVDELNTYPLYIEYNDLLERLDNIYQEIRFILEKYFNDLLS